MADGLRFTKMQGVGNDFVLVDGRGHPERNWARLAVEVCARHTGIGADGLLVVDDSDSADVLMRMFNPDGTPDVCGNGMRCVSRFVTDDGRRMTESAIPTTLTIETLAGIRTAWVEADSGGSVWTVDMGEPRFRPGEIPMLADSE